VPSPCLIYKLPFLYVRTFALPFCRVPTSVKEEVLVKVWRLRAGLGRFPLCFFFCLFNTFPPGNGAPLLTQDSDLGFIVFPPCSSFYVRGRGSYPDPFFLSRSYLFYFVVIISLPVFHPLTFPPFPVQGVPRPLESGQAMYYGIVYRRRGFTLLNLKYVRLLFGRTGQEMKSP